NDMLRVEEHLLRCQSCGQSLLAVPEDALCERLRLAARDAQAADERPAVLRDHPRYRVLRLLGRGGMGAVFLAEHLVMHRLVAVKVLAPGRTGGTPAVERFLREARCASRLHHPNVVATFDAETGEHGCFLVMEYVEGVSLDCLLARRGPLPIAEACGYARQ